MYVTDKLVDFLNTSKNLSNSTIILTDLEKVIFALSDLKNIYIDKKISKELIRFFKFVCERFKFYRLYEYFYE